MRTIIHVNQAVIVQNRKTGENNPPLIARNYKGSTPCHEIEICGPSKVVNRPHKPLPCGARVWIETDGKVICK